MNNYNKKVSKAFMRQCTNKRNLNECLHAQAYYIGFEIKDPEGALVCEVAMSYDQFVRLLLCQSEVTVTLLKYRGIDGKFLEEKVPDPNSVHDNIISRFGEEGESLKNRISDLRKDIYEILNLGKAPGKKALEKLLLDIKTIENHYKSNMPYFVECASEEVSEIQENAKSQLAIFAQSLMKVDLKPEDFTPLIENKNVLSLPEKTIMPVQENYIPKERTKKEIDDMTAMEVADELTVMLRWFEKAENHNLYNASASSKQNKVEILYINYQGGFSVELDVAKRYLKFLKSIKTMQDFKTHYNLEE